MYDPIIRYNNATYRARVHVSKCTHHALLCKNNGIEFAKYITFYSIIYYEHYKKNVHYYCANCICTIYNILIHILVTPDGERGMRVLLKKL